MGLRESIYSEGRDMRLPRDVGRLLKELYDKVRELREVMSPKASGRD